MARYTVDNILFFANQPKGFNVSVDEYKKRGRDFKDTTLGELIPRMLKNGWIEEVGRDDSDVYYKTTKRGEIKHWELKLAYARSKGKDETPAKEKLRELRGAV